MLTYIPALRAESSVLIKLALPILFAQLALTGLGVVDTVMSGRVGTNDLAAIGLGTNIMLPIFIFATGILLAITPMVSKANGKQDVSSVSLFLYQGIWLSIPLGIMALALLMNLEWLLKILGPQPRSLSINQRISVLHSIWHAWCRFVSSPKVLLGRAWKNTTDYVD